MPVQLIFLVPLLCWLLAARSPRIVLGGGVILVAVAAGEFAVANDRLLSAQKTTVLAILIVADVVVFVSGLYVDGWTGGRVTAITIAGTILGAVYCVLSLGGMVAIALITHGQRASIPSAGILPPLPAGLTPTGSQTRCRDYDDSDNDSTVCSRSFEIGSTRGAPATEVADLMVQHLQAHNWPFVYDEKRNKWSACHPAGWGLDRSTLCATVTIRQDRTSVSFDDATHISE
ncbi:hypothetical protein ABIA39_003773 [Nocardia sp. GAS34]|jgi:hypothetical protein|uniref:hypothetical protein n=1 Tax=unclassified Nocardia TaxID=2637762 RepID=UPI003D2078D6